MADLLRLYEPNECGKDGYPLAWHKCPDCNPGDSGCDTCEDGQSIKGLVRVLAGQRCIRCQHPYIVGGHYEGGGEWSPCDKRCTHDGPLRVFYGEDVDALPLEHLSAGFVAGDTIAIYAPFGEVEARWRILTVHHLTGDKADCRWFNLAALCQRDHLEIQGRVDMHKPWPREHSEWSG